jgi:hypothetical protein
VNLIHARISSVSWETGHANPRAAEKATEELVEVSQELAVLIVSIEGPFIR